jgi:hypothetical protein
MLSLPKDEVVAHHNPILQGNILISLAIINYVRYMFFRDLDGGRPHLHRCIGGGPEKCVRSRERNFFERGGNGRFEKSKTSQCGPAARSHQNGVTKEEVATSGVDKWQG